MMTKCQVCGNDRPVRTVMVDGKYYKSICDSCLSDLQGDNSLTSSAASYERRRTYEDNAQDTIQPYDANGQPRVEFLRLYPESAKKVFDEKTINDLKRKI